MEKVQLKCSNCGSGLEKIENQKDTYVCLHCGNKEIIKDTARTTSYFINQNITKNIYGNEKLSDEDYYKLIANAEKFLEIEDYKKAIKLASQARDIDEGNYLAWWVITKAKLLYDITNKKKDKLVLYYSIDNIANDYKKAYHFSKNETKKSLEDEYQELYMEYSKLFSDADVYIDANFEQKDINKVIKIFSAIMIGCLAICIAFLVAVPIFNLPFVVLISLFYPGIIILVVFVVTRNIKLDKQIIEFISSKKECTFEELINKFENKIPNSHVLSEEELIDQIANRVYDLIQSGYLTGYKIEKNSVIKVNKKNYN